MSATTAETVTVGTVNVTTGRLHVGDPCYTLTRDASHAPAARDDVLGKAGRRAYGVPWAAPYGDPGVGAVVTVPLGQHQVTAVIKHKGFGGKRVASATIHFTDQRDYDTLWTIPARRVNLTDLGVDAGLMWFGDPDAFAGEGSLADTATGGDWSKFCGLLRKVEGEGRYGSPLGPGAGVFTDTGFGDGVYPLTAILAPYTDDLLALTVTFIEDEDVDCGALPGECCC